MKVELLGFAGALGVSVREAGDPRVNPRMGRLGKVLGRSGWGRVAG